MADVPSISLDPYLAGVQATLFALQQLGLIPDLNPLDYIIGAFDGKPKLEDTEEAALRLQASPWWPLRALGTNLQIWVRNGVPLSTGNLVLRAQLSEWLRGTISSIEPIVYGRLDPYALDHAIWLSMTSQQGDTAIVQLNNTIAQQHALGPLPPVPDSPTGPPPPPPLPGSQSILTSIDGDTLFDIGSTLNFTLTEIYSQLQLMGTVMQRPGNDQCCTNVVQSISNVVGQLTIIGAALANPQGPTQVTLDFTPLTDAVSSLVTAIGAYPPALQACCAAVNTSLGNIATAINNPASGGTGGIVDQLKQSNANDIIPAAIVDYFVAKKVIPPEVGQLFSDRPWPWLHTVLKGAATISPIIGFAERLFGDDADAEGGQRLLAGFVDDLMTRGIKALANWHPKVNTEAVTALYNFLQATITKENTILGGILAPFVNLIATGLTPPGPTQIGNIGIDPNQPINTATSLTISTNIAAWIGSFFGVDEGSALTHMVELVSEIVGFDELQEVTIGPQVRHGVGKIADMQARKLYGQELPGHGALAGLAARGLITNQQYFTWVPYTGLPGELWEQERQAAYSGLGARRMMSLINTGLFSNAEIQDELTFSGIRPISQQRMLTAAPFLATQPQRHALMSTLEKAYTAGLLDDFGLTDNIDSAQHNTDRNNLILQKVKWDVLIEEAKGLTSEYATLFLGSVIDDPTYRSYLSGIGLQPWKVNLEASKAEARASATLHRKEIAQAAALQRATAAEERKAAMENFKSGNIGQPALALALVATGLTATQAAAWVDLATLQKAAGLRWQYGLQLSAVQATLLRERVAALTDQRKRQQITDAQYVSALQALNIPPEYINALQAAADALLTPRKSAFAIPIQTG